MLAPDRILLNRLENLVSFPALQEHALAHLSVASSEGMSLSLLEGMAFAKPTIVSDIRENTAVVGSDAVIVKTNDAANLSHAMEFLLEMTPDERRSMGAMLAARAAERHDWNTIAADTHRLYEEAVAAPRAPRVRVWAS